MLPLERNLAWISGCLEGEERSTPAKQTPAEWAQTALDRMSAPVPMMRMELGRVA